MKQGAPHGRHFPSFLVLIAGIWAGVAGAEDFRYRYVSLDEATLPENIEFFWPAGVTDTGRVIGNAYECVTSACDELRTYVAAYYNGSVTLRRRGLALVNNGSGTVGGSVPTAGLTEQAALFHGRRLERIPRLPDEVSSYVLALSDAGSALVASWNNDSVQSFVLYKDGVSTVLDFGPDIAEPGALAINDRDVVSGTQGIDTCDGATGFRFNTRTGVSTLLLPRSTEPASAGVDINNSGQVLGRSFICDGRERIGVWNRNGVFRTWFVEGIPRAPQVSNRLLFNDAGLIVITYIYAPNAEFLKTSYLVPEPGVRLDLADLVSDLPEGVSLSEIFDINERGDMVGLDWVGGSGPFLLKRVGPVAD